MENIIRFLTDKSEKTKTDSTTDDNSNQANETFKMILIGIIVVLCVFLLFFVYNLIKCYLPKWMGNQNRLEEEDRSIEFDKI